MIYYRSSFTSDLPTSGRILKLLNHLSPEQFLSEYWQKKPLLIRQAIPDYECPVDADELAGLAMEEEVESRIVIENDQGKPWQALNGPFAEDDFKKLPETHWTLLIQQLDAWSPEVNELKALFDFIPYWRFDDIMASYAPEGGSVGPHYDQYDVFLLQASGKRHWRIGQMCDEHSPRQSGTPLRILEHFEETDGWILEPGDMLYLPPNIAHYGIALDAESGAGDCITLSVGYKAPTHTQVLSHLTDHLIEQINPHLIYEDPELTLCDDPHKISEISVNKIRQILKQHLDNNEYLTQWFGEFVSAPKNENTLQANEDQLVADEIIDALTAGNLLYKNEASRFFYSEKQAKLSLFVDGLSFDLDESLQSFVKLLCNHEHFGDQDLSPYWEIKTIKQILEELTNHGSLYLD